jgi:glutathione peroxidase
MFDPSLFAFKLHLKSSNQVQSVKQLSTTRVFLSISQKEIMQKLTLILALFLTLTITAQNTSNMTIYDFSVPALEGGTIDFNDYKGKKILIVNTASECGYTPQYKQLEELNKEMGDNVVIIGFPANNFGGQEPGSNEQIAAFCEKNYGVSFPMAAKVSVKGADQHELFKWLTSEENEDFIGDINWNFEKFLIDEEGNLVHRYRSGASPMDEAILSALED